MSLRNAMDFYWRVSAWEVKIIPSFESPRTFGNVRTEHKKRGASSEDENFKVISDPQEIVCTDACRIRAISETGPPDFSGYSFNISLSNMSQYSDIITGFGEYKEDPLNQFQPNFYGFYSFFFFTGGFAALLRPDPIFNPQFQTKVGTIKIFFEDNVYESPGYGPSPEFNPQGREIFAELRPKAYRTFE